MVPSNDLQKKCFIVEDKTQSGKWQKYREFSTEIEMHYVL